MLKEKSIIAVIPARAGSKGIKNKNIVELGGKPLIAYSIQTALKSKYIDKVIVSTDGEDIANISRAYGADVPFLRPKELSGDSAKTIDTVLHAIDYFKELGENFDVLVLLQPTQPLRTVDDLDGALELFFTQGQRSLVSVSQVDDHPLLIRSIQPDLTLKNLLNSCSTCRRQDMPLFYRVNGAIYINNVSELSLDTSFNDNVIPYIMEKSHSVDIDDVMDLKIAELYLSKDKD